MFSGKIKKFTLVILVLVMIFNLLGFTYGAGLRASPAEFKFTNMSTSSTVSGQVTVTNIGNDSMNVTVLNKRLLMDSVHLIYSDEGIATWINVGLKNFVLAPGASKVVPFTLTTPAHINYYDAEGALIIAGVPLQTQSGIQNLSIKQGINLVIPLIVGLPGPITESLQVLQYNAPMVLLSYMPGDFTYQLHNNGTVYANMTGDIEINGLLSSHKVPVQGEIYPGDNYTLQTSWTPGLLDFGLYSANTNMSYGRFQQDKTLQTSSTILVIPVWLIVLLILAVVIWTIRKKEIQSPIKIKIERKK